jgi:hypothetical protein
VQDQRNLVALGGSVQRLEFRRVQRFPGDVGEQKNPPEIETMHGPLVFGHGRGHVLEGQRGQPGEAASVRGAQLRQVVVADPRPLHAQFRCQHLRPGNVDGEDADVDPRCIHVADLRLGVVRREREGEGLEVAVRDDVRVPFAHGPSGRRVPQEQLGIRLRKDVGLAVYSHDTRSVGVEGRASEAIP